jgi:5-hydroxyisourate hydrolase-like protein (transthyretin family)
MEISLWKKPEKEKEKENSGDYQVKMKQKSYFRTEDTHDHQKLGQEKKIF